MSTQLALEWPRTESRFQRFHEENPHVYRELVALCRRAKAQGYRRWSIKSAFEVLRWSRLQTVGDDWKLNNNHHAKYARMIMDNEADLDGFFLTREKAE